MACLVPKEISPSAATRAQKPEDYQAKEARAERVATD